MCVCVIRCLFPVKSSLVLIVKSVLIVNQSETQTVSVIDPSGISAPQLVGAAVLNQTDLFL